MLRIRFLRTGRKNQPFFRLVVTDKRKPPKAGRFLEILGFFNPLTKEKNLKAERIKYWLGVGAQSSKRAHNLLAEEGIIKEAKKPVHSKAKKKKSAESPVDIQAIKPAETKPETKPETKAEVKAKDEPKLESKPADEQPKTVDSSK